MLSKTKIWQFYLLQLVQSLNSNRKFCLAKSLQCIGCRHREPSFLCCPHRAAARHVLQHSWALREVWRCRGKELKMLLCPQLLPYLGTTGLLQLCAQLTCWNHPGRSVLSLPLLSILAPLLGWDRPPKCQQVAAVALAVQFGHGLLSCFAGAHAGSALLARVRVLLWSRITWLASPCSLSTVSEEGLLSVGSFTWIMQFAAFRSTYVFQIQTRVYMVKLVFCHFLQLKFIVDWNVRVYLPDLLLIIRLR